MELLPELNKRNKVMNVRTRYPIYKVITIVKIYVKGEIADEHEINNNETESDTAEISLGQMILLRSHQVEKCRSMNVIGKMLQLFILVSSHKIFMRDVFLHYLLI